METRITLKVPLAGILAPFPEKIAEKMGAELKQASKHVKGGVHCITGEALFGILQKNRILIPRANNPSPQFQGATKTQENRLAWRNAAKQTIKLVLTPDGNQSPKVIYLRYEEKAKTQGGMPYSYAWFRVLYGEVRL